MTDPDVLTQFAAEKCGVEIQRYVDCWVIKGRKGPLITFAPLTSWEWLGKGLEALPYPCTIGSARLGILGKQLCEVEIETIKAIPRAFWECWKKLSELEEGKNHET